MGKGPPPWVGPVFGGGFVASMIGVTAWNMRRHTVIMDWEKERTDFLLSDLAVTPWYGQRDGNIPQYQLETTLKDGDLVMVTYNPWLTPLRDFLTHLFLLNYVKSIRGMDVRDKNNLQWSYYQGFGIVRTVHGRCQVLIQSPIKSLVSSWGDWFWMDYSDVVATPVHREVTVHRCVGDTCKDAVAISLLLAPEPGKSTAVANINSPMAAEELADGEWSSPIHVKVHV